MMSFLSFAALASLAVATNSSASVNGTTNGTASYSTEVVTAYTTYCPFPTTFSEGSSTYTVSEPTTLTITDCPCTRTHTYQTTTVTSCSSSSSGAPAVAATNATSGPAFANGVAKNSVPLAALGGAAAVAIAFI